MSISEYHENTKLLLQNLVDKERIVAAGRDAFWGEVEELLKSVGRCSLKTFTSVAKAGVSSVPGGTQGWEIVDSVISDVSVNQTGEHMDIGGAVDMLGEWAGFQSGDDETSCTGAILDTICSLSQGIVENGAKKMIGNRAALTGAGQILDDKMGTWKNNIANVADSMPAPVSLVQNASSVCETIENHTSNFNSAYTIAEACAGEPAQATATLQEWSEKFEEWAKLCGHYNSHPLLNSNAQ